MRFSAHLALTTAALAAAAACGGPPPATVRAQRLLSTGDFQGAERAADEGLALHPREGSLWRIKIRATMERGDSVAAVGQYRQWRDLAGGDDPEALRMMAHTVLHQGLRLGSTDLTSRAIQIVERHELERLAPDVANLVASDDDIIAAAAAVAVLSAHPQAPQVLVDLLTSEEPRARAIAVSGIGRKVGSHARADLLPSLRDPDPAVRRAAVAAIARIGDDADRPRLAEMATSDAAGPVRAAALTALVGADDQLALDAALAGIKDDYLGARLAAISVLASHGDARADQALVEAAAGADLAAALRAATDLYRRGQPPAVELLQRAIRSPAWSVRASALNAAARALPKDHALTLAGTALLDRRTEVRLTAARLLLRFGVDERAIAELKRALSDAREQPRLIAATDLARRGDQDAIAALSTLATSSAAATRQAAIQAHATAGVTSDGLLAGFADESSEVRLATADAVLTLARD